MNLLHAPRLAGRGLTPKTDTGFAHRPDGSVAAPDGSRVAWFTDPDGTIFSVVQYPAP